MELKLSTQEEQKKFFEDLDLTIIEKWLESNLAKCKLKKSIYISRNKANLDLFSKNIVEQTGIFRDTLKSVKVETFGPARIQTIENNPNKFGLITFSLHLKSEYKDNEKVDKYIATFFYDLNDNEWIVKPAKDSIEYVIKLDEQGNLIEKA